MTELGKLPGVKCKETWIVETLINSLSKKVEDTNKLSTPGFAKKTGNLKKADIMGLI